MSNILTIFAHTEKAEFFAGGTLAKYTREGWEITEIYLSTKEIRRPEQREASKVIGAKEVIFLDEVDSRIEEKLELRIKLAHMVRKIRPEIVISHYFGGHMHPDMTATGKMAFDACYMAAIRSFESPEPQHQISHFWTASFMGMDEGFEPNIFVDIADTLDIKRAALERLEVLCQEMFGGNKEFLLDNMLTPSKYYGFISGVKWAEAFQEISMFHFKPRARKFI